MSTTAVADGVYLISEAHVNFYLVEDDEGVTVVDSGLPAMWGALVDALRGMGRSINDVRAVVLTHAHFDHLGLARRLRTQHGVPVWVHPDDAFIARHPYRYRHERSRVVFSLTHPAGLPVLAQMTRAGALHVRGVEDLTYFPGHGRPPGQDAGERQVPLPVPGSPEVVFSPGHTSGHCALYLPSRGVLFSGDALVTLDPYTGRTGPRIVAGAATADSAQNLESLSALERTGARVVLPGHGDPWTRGIEEAVAIARDHGPA